MLKNNFMFEMLKYLKNEYNIFFSNKNIFDCFSMAYTGSSGQTKEKLADFFGYNEDIQKNSEEIELFNSQLNSKDIVLNTANSIWAKQDLKIKQQFLNLVKADVHLVNFFYDLENVIIDINKWVENKTNGKIKELVNNHILNEDTLLALISTIYFFGEWDHFKEKNTEQSIFYNIDSTKSECKMMHNTSFSGEYAENLYLQAIKIPYKDPNYNLIIVLPKNNNIFNNILNELNQKWFEDILFTNKNKIDLYLPKWTNSLTYNLKEIFSHLGLTNTFSSNSEFDNIADFNLKIDAAIHQATIDVNEQGTEASGATVLGVFESYNPAIGYRTIFKADRPFYYFIMNDQVNSILFAGKLSKINET